VGKADNGESGKERKNEVGDQEGRRGGKREKTSTPGMKRWGSTQVGGTTGEEVGMKGTGHLMEAGISIQPLLA